MMRKYITIAASLFIISLSSCLKKDDTACNNNYVPPTAPSSEIQSVQNYITANNIQGTTQHSSGMFYTIIDPGTGASPSQCNAVSVRYTGKLTNGSIFDQATSPVSFNLSGLIPGWRIGIPLIKAGGTVRLFIPPTLGYGARQQGTIPANSILIFDIDLVNVG